MSDTNIEVPATKRTRKKRTFQERMADLAKQQLNLQISQAKDVLEGIPSFAEIREAANNHKKFLAEGKLLADDAKYSERVAHLSTRLANLKSKRAIAMEDAPRRELILEEFETFKSRIGALILERAKVGETVTTAEVQAMFNEVVSSSSVKLLLDVNDPYLAFRRAKSTEAQNSATFEDVENDLED